MNIRKDIKGIIFIGGSVVAGRGVKNRSLGFASIIKRELKIPVLIKGKSYLTSGDILNIIRRYIIYKPADYSHIILLSGNNDSRLVDINTPAISAEQFKRNLIDIILTLHEHNKEIIICNLQPLSDEQIAKIHLQMAKALTLKNFTPHTWHKQYSDACEEVAKEMNVEFINIRAPLEKSKEEVIADYCLDPNALGHSIVAKTILNKLKA